MSIDAYDYGKEDGRAEENKRLADLLRSKRCECLDMSIEQMNVAYPDPKERWFQHGNCDWVGLDWVIELIEKGEQDVPPTTLD